MNRTMLSTDGKGMNNPQLEMSLDPARRSTSSRQRKASRPRAQAQWWFRKMRDVVDSALDWRPAPPARPEQTYLRFSR